ncbi:MAG: hypothetical protein IKL74_05465 [Clostridia bacterium]|nr:hypothetical protein [Clostridia bacterium]
MKKILCIMLILALIGIMPVFAGEGDIVLLPINSDIQEGIEIGTSAKHWGRNEYICFKGVDLTGINSVTAEMEYLNLTRGSGETIRVRVDDPMTGQEVAFIVISEPKDKYTAYLGGISGVHDLYFIGTYWDGYATDLRIKSFTLSKDVYVEDLYDKQVDDSYIKDFYTDTWVATDDFGRKVAEYGEAGPVKEGERYVGMMYWNWTDIAPTSNACIISEVLAEHPDAMTIEGSSAWTNLTKTYWDEPVYGFYSSHDYWVYRRHAELLSAAGVDSIFLDYSNGGSTRISMLMSLAKAFRDAKKDGVDIPEISVFCGSWTGNYDLVKLFLSLYNTCFQQEDMTDIWFHWDDKPLIFGIPNVDGVKKQFSGDPQGRELMEIIGDFFSFREDDNVGEKDSSTWRWIEDFPQLGRGNKTNDTRPEFTCVGVALNVGYAGNHNTMNDPYAQGRNYSRAFGDDYTVESVREAYYFREQAYLALERDPHFIYVDGWNEFCSELHRNYSGFDLAFPDAFDSEHSRDFEPVKGLLKDDCYNMLCDLVRKYKGVRPAPVATEEITIDINANVSQWENVGPEFLNYKGQDRSGKDAFTDSRIGEVKTYDIKVANRVISSKAARDGENLYFMAKADKAIALEDGALQLLINSDRNPKTGVDGYDYVLGRIIGKAEALAKNGEEITYTEIGTYEYAVSGDSIQLKLPRVLIGETEKIDMELKWLSGTYTEVIDFYSNLNTAPIGRFNYLYTELPQLALTKDERSALDNSSVLVAGKEKMIVSGGIMNVSEKDTSVTPFEMNGTLYVPRKAFEEIVGWGRSKTEYDHYSNILRFYNYELNEDLTDFAENNWYYTYIGTLEARKNGKLLTLTAPVVVANGDIYIPLSILSDCMGKTVISLGNGAYLVGNAAQDTAKSVIHYID